MMKKKNDGFKKIKSLFYIVAIISMIIAIFGKVSAVEFVGYNTWFDYVYYDTYNRMNSSTKSSMDNLGYQNFVSNLVSNFPYFVRYSNSDTNGVYYIFSTLEEFSVQTMWGSFSNNIVHVKANYSSSSLTTSGYNFSYNNAYPDPVMISFNGYNWNCILVSIFITDDGYVQINNLDFYYATTPNTNMNYYENGDLISTVSRNTTTLNGSGKYLYAFYSNKIDSSEHTFDTFDSNCKCFVTQDYNRSVYNHLDNTLHLGYAYDSNFIIYKSYGVGGISDPLLNIQYADDIFSQGYTYTTSTTYNLTFDVDGMETTVSISSSAYPDDFFENGSFRTSFDLIYRMLSNKIVNFSSADTVTLTAVSMSSTAYPTSDQQATPETVTKSTLCNLILKGSQGSTDIESDVIPAVSDVTIVYDQVVGSDDFHNHTGSYNLNQPVPSWADTYTIVMYTDGNYGSGKPWSTVDLYFNYEDFLYFNFDGYTDPNITFNGLPDTYIGYDHLHSIVAFPEYLISYLGLLNSCDVIRFVFGAWGSDGWETDGDYVFYLQNYYTKLSIKGLGNIQSAVESGTYYTKSLYWYLKQRLDNMSDNIAEYEEKALSNQVDGNGYLQSINTNIISIKDSIDTGVNSIVSAISGISGGSSSYSLPSLSAELQRLFIPSLTWQSIDFDEYMDSLGVLSLPFSFTNDVLDIADNSYSSTLDLHINDFSLDVTGHNDVLTIFEDQDYSFNPRSIFANDVWTMLTYLNAFALILGEAWITYCHIFRRGMQNDC